MPLIGDSAFNYKYQFEWQPYTSLFQEKRGVIVVITGILNCEVIVNFNVAPYRFSTTNMEQPQSHFKNTDDSLFVFSVMASIACFPFTSFFLSIKISYQLKMHEMLQYQ